MPQSPLRTSSTRTQVTGRRFSPSISTIVSVILPIISCFCSGVNTPSISFTVTSGICCSPHDGLSRQLHFLGPSCEAPCDSGRLTCAPGTQPNANNAQTVGVACQDRCIAGRVEAVAMKFRVGREALGEAVAWVARALSPRPVVPTLAGLLLQADDDGLVLSCFDYEVSARMRIEANVKEPGLALVPGRLLAEITRSLPALDVEVASNADSVTLTCGSAEFDLVSLPVAEYPE